MLGSLVGPSKFKLDSPAITNKDILKEQDMTTPDPLPGSDGSILSPGAAERLVDKTVTRQALFTPKDEEPPPSGPDGKPTGANWFEHNYRPRPVALSIRLSIDSRPLADALNPFVEASDMAGFLRVLSSLRSEVVAQEGNPIVILRLHPK
jgi:hypothetical protein